MNSIITSKIDMEQSEKDAEAADLQISIVERAIQREHFAIMKMRQAEQREQSAKDNNQSYVDRMEKWQDIAIEAALGKNDKATAVILRILKEYEGDYGHSTFNCNKEVYRCGDTYCDPDRECDCVLSWIEEALSGTV